MVLQRSYAFTINWWDYNYVDTWYFVVTVFAKPPSEPKLSQLSSEEEEEVSMGTSGTLRKLLKLILVDGGGWTTSFYKWEINMSHFYKLQHKVYSTESGRFLSSLNNPQTWREVVYKLQVPEDTNQDANAWVPHQVVQAPTHLKWILISSGDLAASNH